MPFSARALRENIFFWPRKKHNNVKIEIWFIVVCTLIDNEYASLPFSQTFFSYCFCMLSDFAKVFERKVWRVQVAHLHNVARALSISIVNKSWQKFLCLSLILWLKKQLDCGLAWHWWNSTDLGLIDMFLINLNAEIVAYILSFRKSRHKPNVENTSKYGFSPDLGGKMAAFWACACKLSWTLLSHARVQPLYGAGRKESSGTGLGWRHDMGQFFYF